MLNHMRNITKLIVALTIVMGMWISGANYSNAAPTYLSDLSAGDYVSFGGKTWILIDPNSRYLITEDSQGMKSFDAYASPDYSSDNTFDPSDPTEVAYWLNNSFYNSLNNNDWIINTNWTVGDETNESALTVSAKVGLISYSEWKDYSIAHNSTTGFLPNPSSGWTWTRTPLSNDTSWVWYIHPTLGTLDIEEVGYQLDVFPTLYLKSGLFVSNGNGTSTNPYIITDNRPPSLGLTNSNSIMLSGSGTATLSGEISDPDGDVVTVTAAINGATKTKQIDTPDDGSVTTWSLSWSGTELNQGSYSNIVISADDGKDGSDSVTYTNTITVDKSAPTGSHALNTTSWTNGNVTITVNASDTGGAGFRRIKKPDNTYSNSTSTTYTVDANGTYRFILEDKVGNKSNYDVSVSNIDKITPTGTTTQTPTAATNGNVTINLIASDTGGSGLDKVKLPDGSWDTTPGSSSFIATVDGTYTFIIYDKAGNSKTVNHTVNNIDKSSPTASHILSPNSWTNNNVMITISASDNGGSGFKRIQKPDGNYENSATVTYEVNTNGTYSFLLEDNASNITNYDVTISNIDKVKPNITINPIKETTWTTTAYDIDVTITDDASGVNSHQYELSTSTTPTDNWSNAGDSSFTVSINKENEWFLHVKGMDAAGNSNIITTGPYRYFVLSGPQNVKVTNLTTNSLDVEFDQEADHEYYIELRDKDGSAIANSGWGASSGYTFNSLTPNAQYTVAVKSRKHGQESSYQTAATTYTNAVDVTSATFTPQDKAIKITLDIAATGNDTGTEYIIKNMDTGETSPKVTSEWINTNLFNDMAYKYMAKVVNRNGSISDWQYLGIGTTQMTKIAPPIGWDDPVGGEDPIDLDNGEFDPDEIDGKVIEFNGEKYIVVKGKIVTVSATNVTNASQYAISLTGFGYSGWKDLDDTGSFSEDITLNNPGLYHVHIKFRNDYGTESEAFVRNFIVDWIKPEMSSESKIKRQTATTDGSFSINASGEENLSLIMYYDGSIWRRFINGQDIEMSGISLNNTRQNVDFKFSDLNGNVTSEIYKIWGIN